MKAPLLDSLTLKISSFLRTAGVSAPNADTPPPGIVHVLDREHDLSLMSFLEREWLEEQITRDFETGVFSPLVRARQ